MKKLYLVFLAIISITLIASSSAAQTNLLTNSDFEDGKVGASWTTGTIPGWKFAPSDWEVQNYFVHKGSQAMKIWDPNVEIYQDFSIQPGNGYAISAYAYTPSDDQLNKMDSVLKVEWYSKGSKIGSEEIGWVYGLGSSHGSPAPVDKWKLISKTVTAPSGAETGRVRLHFDHKEEGWKGAVAWDEVSVVRK